MEVVEDNEPIPSASSSYDYARSRVRSSQDQLEKHLARLSAIRKELLAITDLSKIEQLNEEFQKVNREAKSEMLTMQTAIQNALSVSTSSYAPSSSGAYVSAKRLQEIGNGYVTQLTALAIQISNRIEEGRRSSLYQGVSLVGHPKRDEDARSLLHQEQSSLDTSLTILSDTIIQAKSSVSNLMTQSVLLSGAQKKGNRITETVLPQLQSLFSKIKRAQRFNQIVLAAVVAVCLIVTYALAIR